jgi:cell division transport system permease protein
MFSHLGYNIREATVNLKRTRGMAFVATSTVGLSLFILGLFLLTTMNIRQAVRYLQDKVEIEVFLEDAASREQTDSLLSTIHKLDGVREAVYVSKEDALHEAALDTSLLRATGTNPLPASIRVRMKDGFRSERAIAGIVGAIEGTPAVEEIASGREWARYVDRLILILTIITATIGILFGLTSIFVISNTVQLAIFSRRGIIAIMELVGAKDSFIRGPFILEGTIQGIVGGGLAVAGISAVYWAAQQKIDQLLPLAPPVLVSFVVVGGLLGGIASGTAVDRYLKTERTM